jgi:PAS domain S-box-containing protein
MQSEGLWSDLMNENIPETEVVLKQPWFIERRSVIIIGLVVFLLISATASFLCYQHYEQAKELSLREDRATARLVSLILDEHIRMIIRTMESYTSRPLFIRAVRERNSEKTKIHLVDLVRKDQFTESLVITDSGGTLWASYPERPEIIGKNFAYRDWHKSISKSWTHYVSDVALRIVAEKDTAIHVCVPICDENGNVISILLNTQRTGGLSKIFGQIVLDPGGSVSITDRKGNIVFSTLFPYNKEVTPYPLYFVKEKAASTKSSSATIEYPFASGSIRYISYAPAADIGWSVFVGRDNRQIFMTEMLYFIQTGFISLLLFLVIIISLFYLRKQIENRRIQEQMEAERKHLESERKYHDLFSGNRDGVVVVDEKGRFLDANRTHCDMLGYTIEELRSMNSFLDITPEKWRKWEWEEIWEQRLMKQGYSDIYEKEFIRKDKTIFPVELQYFTIRDDSGQPRYIWGTARDIAERKEAEETLARLNRELAAKNAELEQVFFVASHDLRSPLVNIDGYGKELGHAVEDLCQAFAEGDRIPIEVRRKVTPILEHDIPDALHFIRTGTSKMDGLLTGLLRISRSGRAALTINQLDMNRLISGVVEQAGFQIKESGAELHIDNLPLCKGDALQVNQIFSNLLDNAMKFLEPQRPGVIMISGTIQGERSVYCVEDNGIGIAPAHQQVIFEIFHRLNPDKSIGEGLGLTIIKRILSRLGGEIWVESKPGEGSRFYVALPII